MEDCVFCKIVKKEIPADIIKETEGFLVIPDIRPSAPLHLLIIPKVHIEDIRGISDEQWMEVKKIALELGEEKNQVGYRLANNAGEAAAIKHFHVHFMGGIKSDHRL